MGHVYILEAAVTWKGQHLIKIGMTDRPNVCDRISEIQNQWADDRNIQINRYYSAHVADPTAIEAYMHRLFKAPVRLYNKDLWAEFGNKCDGDSEFFQMDDDTLSQAVAVLQQYEIADRPQYGYDREPVPWAGIVAVGFGIAVAIVAMLGIFGKSDLKPAPKTAIVTSAVNVRSRPNKSAPIAKDAQNEQVKPLKKGSTVSIIEEENGWIKIGEGRWVAGNFTKRTKGAKQNGD